MHSLPSFIRDAPVDQTASIGSFQADAEINTPCILIAVLSAEPHLNSSILTDQAFGSGYRVGPLYGAFHLQPRMRLPVENSGLLLPELAGIGLQEESQRMERCALEARGDEELKICLPPVQPDRCAGVAAIPA